jgi:predicted RNA-binding protein
MKFWINTISKNHVLKGIEGGFTQADHGKNSRLKRLAKGDYMVFYSPKTEYKGGVSLQAFTGIGRITDEIPYQVVMNPEFHPWRRKLKFVEHRETSIKELIEELDFIKDKKHWGYPFRRGLFEVSQSDFRLIATAMGIKL